MAGNSGVSEVITVPTAGCAGVGPRCLAIPIALVGRTEADAEAGNNMQPPVTLKSARLGATSPISR